ncbi:MAG: hypothetical protein ACRCZK_06795 [Oscillospiraceae bacterium]
MLKKTKKITLTSITCSISITLMLLTTVFPFSSYALPGIAGSLFSIIVIEVNRKWATMCYIVTSLLSVFLVPDKEVAFMFIFLLGYYPILKSLIEEKYNKPIQYIIKILIFNFSIILAYSILIFILKIPSFKLEENNISTLVPVFLLLFGNITFILYDIAITQCIAVYIYKYRNKIFKRLR